MSKCASFVTALVFLGLSACSSKSDAEKFADSYCGEVVKCCAQAGMSSNGAFCHLGMSGGGFDKQAADACLAEVKSEVAAGTFCGSLSSPSVCNSVFSTPVGNKQPGETCQADSDCAPSSDGQVACAGLYVDTGWIYKCQVRMPGKAGDACVGTQNGTVFQSVSTTPATDIPPRGYVCNVADGLQCKSGTCVVLAEVGGSCTYSSDCVPTAFCDTTSKCAAAVAAGGACTGNDSAECVAGYYCPTTGTKQCTAQLANGAPCTDDSMCQSGNCSSTCQPGFLDTMGLAVLCAG